MARVDYIVNDILGQMCETLGITGQYELLGGHYAFDSTEKYDATRDAVYNYIWAMYEDEDFDNDAQADAYLDALDATDYTVMYWSTESSSWV